MPTTKEISKLKIGETYRDSLSELGYVPKIRQTLCVGYCELKRIGLLDQLPSSTSVTHVEVVDVSKKYVKFKIKDRNRGTTCKTGSAGVLVPEEMGNMCVQYERPCNVQTKEFCPLS